MAYHYKSANQSNALFCSTKSRVVGVASPEQTGSRRSRCAQWQVSIDRFLVLTLRNSVAAWLAQQRLYDVRRTVGLPRRPVKVMSSSTRRHLIASVPRWEGRPDIILADDPSIRTSPTDRCSFSHFPYANNSTYAFKLFPHFLQGGVGKWRAGALKVRM